MSKNPKGYDWTAAIGVLIALGPDIITALTSGPDAPVLPKWARVSLHIIGTVLAAQGLPLLMRKRDAEPPAPPTQGGGDAREVYPK